MEKIKRAYYYLFYKFYKMSEAAPSRWLSDWKAGLVIIVLEMWLGASILCYYTIFIDRYLKITKLYFIILGLIVFIINYFTFINTDIWKDYVKEFDNLPKKINKRGSWIVLGIVIFILANLIFSFYLRFQIDWSQYR